MVTWPASGSRTAGAAAQLTVSIRDTRYFNALTSLTGLLSLERCAGRPKLTKGLGSFYVQPIGQAAGPAKSTEARPVRIHSSLMNDRSHPKAHRCLIPPRSTSTGFGLSW